MKKDGTKKIMVFGIILLFIALALIPAINADITKKDTVEKIPGQTIENKSGSLYDLLIITPKKFYNQLQPLVCHKNKMGLSTKLVTLDEVYVQGYWGYDEPEKIKYFIRSALDEWGIKYVLLIGGKKGQTNQWHMPVRYVNMGNDWESHYLSDLYFADIYDSEGNFSSWDSDEDGIYGEWFNGDQPEDTHIDLHPDVAVGRLACRNKLEVRIMVNKIIAYETTTFGKERFNELIAIAGDTYPEYKDPKWVGYEGEYYADRAIENMTGFNSTKLYTSNGTLTHWRDIVKALNKGCGFVYFVGHGSPMIWTNHLPNNETRIKGFGIFQMPLLRNRKMLPVCVVSGCHNSQFDVSIFKFFNATARSHGEYAPECWSWHMTRKIGGGSIATIGCTALGFTKEDKVSFKGGINEIEVAFFKQYGQNEIDILGDAWTAAVDWYLDTYPVDWNTPLSNDSWIDVQVPQSWVILGDPSLKIGGYPLQ